MPSIEISQEQVEALARGEHIVVHPPRRRQKYVVVHSPAGLIYLWEDGADEYVCLTNGIRVITGGKAFGKEGFDFDYTLVPVDDWPSEIRGWRP